MPRWQQIKFINFWPHVVLMSLSLGIFFLSACASSRPGSEEDLGLAALPDNGLEVQIMPQKIKLFPGKIALATYPWQASSPITQIVCDGRAVPFFYHDGFVKAYLTDSYFTKAPRAFDCEVDYTWHQQQRHRLLWIVQVKKFFYPQERLQVDKKHVILSKADQKRVEAERKITAQVYQNGHPTPYFREGFQRPLDSKITSYYGRRRIFNKGVRTQHLGTDFRAAEGTPIRNVNTGKVVLVADLFYTGNTVIVDHGLEIFSIYGHLSEPQVQVGEMVGPGDIIGLSGATGRVSGPHLHWGVKMQGLNSDGLSLVKAGF
jgi:hypothetical protein